MSASCARNSRLVNSTSTMPVQLTKLVMSASVTVRPMVLNCRPAGRSSKQKPSPTVSIADLPDQLTTVVESVGFAQPGNLVRVEPVGECCLGLVERDRRLWRDRQIWNGAAKARRRCGLDDAVDFDISTPHFIVRVARRLVSRQHWGKAGVSPFEQGAPFVPRPGL